jgi:hypothetical protein
MRLIHQYGDTWLRCCNVSTNPASPSGITMAAQHLRWSHGFTIAGARKQIRHLLKRQKQKGQ